MELENIAAGADKQDIDQLIAGWAGIAACGMITAIIWFYAIQAISQPADVLPSVQVGAADVTPVQP